ncbi:hypothetical protein GCM10009677_28400 [Sphaerisporangium rubeum]|uniref:Lytic transglycosylase domain-containing protein n=1 Tax=Sphaerisporangium rubeum TaxID=321317 RepID=A0A7X0ICY4_9ACTN|nr:hypothetical protein [Sphaerisporangium rubeum]
MIAAAALHGGAGTAQALIAGDAEAVNGPAEPLIPGRGGLAAATLPYGAAVKAHADPGRALELTGPPIGMRAGLRLRPEKAPAATPRAGRTARTTATARTAPTRTGTTRARTAKIARAATTTNAARTARVTEAMRTAQAWTAAHTARASKAAHTTPTATTVHLARIARTVRTANAAKSARTARTARTVRSLRALRAQRAARIARAAARRHVRRLARAPQGRNKVIAYRLVAQRDWPLAQFRCLDSLWTRESGWNHRAQNPSSGAYGIPQALPGNKMVGVGQDWRVNPITQIRWGLKYIKGRYGNPCGAWGHFRSHNWY